MKKPILLIGYDVETQCRSKTTIKFLELAPKIHEEYNAPCTFFVLGKTLICHLDEFRRLINRYSDIVDIQQHTFSHIPFKTIVIEYRGYRVIKSAHPERIRTEIQITSFLLNKLLGVDCIGLTTPWCYYRGLLDRPDILEILWESGIKFVRSWGRNEKDSLPVSLDIQPFWYDEIVKNYPPILECCIQGWHDNTLKERLRSKEEYLSYVKKMIDEIVNRKLIWSYCQHDHSSFWKDPDMSITEKLIEYALENNVIIMSYKQFYEEMLKERKLK